MPSLSFSARNVEDASTIATDCAILPLYKGKNLGGHDRQLDKAAGGALKAALALGDFSAKKGETLFLPIGRLLLDLLKRGLLTRLSPLGAEQGAGFYLELAGRREASEDEGASAD